MRCLLQAYHRGPYIGVRSAGVSWTTSGSSSAAGIPHRVPCRAMGSMSPSQHESRRTIRLALRASPSAIPFHCDTGMSSTGTGTGTHVGCALTRVISLLSPGSCLRGGLGVRVHSSGGAVCSRGTGRCHIIRCIASLFSSSVPPRVLGRPLAFILILPFPHRHGWHAHDPLH